MRYCADRLILPQQKNLNYMEQPGKNGHQLTYIKDHCEIETLIYHFLLTKPCLKTTDYRFFPILKATTSKTLYFQKLSLFRKAFRNHPSLFRNRFLQYRPNHLYAYDPKYTINYTITSHLPILTQAL